MSAFDRAAEMGRMLSEDAQFAYILSVDVGWPDSTWADARQICEDEGLSFAKILSQEDQNKMRFKLRGFKEANGNPEADGIYNPRADPNCDSNNDGSATIEDWPCGMWIGGSDQAKEGDWKWTSGQLFSHYNFGGFDSMTQNISGLYPWGNKTCDTQPYPCGSDNEPNDYGVGEDCVRLDLQYSDGLWNDVSCEWLSPFVCELALDNSTWRGGFILSLIHI